MAQAIKTKSIWAWNRFSFFSHSLVARSPGWRVCKNWQDCKDCKDLQRQSINSQLQQVRLAGGKQLNQRLCHGNGAGHARPNGTVVYCPD